METNTTTDNTQESGTRKNWSTPEGYVLPVSQATLGGTKTIDDGFNNS